MLDEKGAVCEFDGYKVPEQMPDTPERKKLHDQAVKEGQRIAEELRKKYGF